MDRKFAVARRTAEAGGWRLNPPDPLEVLEAATRIANERDCPEFIVEVLPESDAGGVPKTRFADPFFLAENFNPHGIACVVELWHMKDLSELAMKDRFAEHAPATLSRAGYELVAEFVVQAVDALDSVYAASQSLERAWNPIRRCRSTSVGDVLVVHESAWAFRVYRVMGMGFSEVAEFV